MSNHDPTASDLTSPSPHVPGDSSVHFRPAITAHPSPIAETAHPRATGWSWVPIRSLGDRHRARITEHLTALGDIDRYLRFGYPASDAQISKYVDMLDFDHDEIFGIFNRRLQLIALAHLAHPDAASATRPSAMAEFGVSVLPHARRRGFGNRLFEHAMLHARNRGVQTLMIHALSENRAMLKIARGAGATVERDGSESEAWLRLPADTLASHVGERFEQQAAEFDYRLKRGARQFGGLIDAVAELRDAVGRTARVAEE